jgi:sporulation-control protein
MFKSIMRSFGVGGASVDTVLDNPEVEVGGELAGEIRITGGNYDQEIQAVVLEIATRAMVETRGDEKVYAEIELGTARLQPGRVGAGENKVLPFRLRLPDSAPLSMGSTRTMLKTRLDVPGAIDPRDSDEIHVRPTRVMMAVFDGIERAGFRLAETEVEYNARRANPFVQEFDFKPRSSRDWGVEEVEISFKPVSRGVEVSLTVDSRGGFFMAGGERTARFRVTEADLGRLDLAAELRRAIDSLRR